MVFHTGNPQKHFKTIQNEYVKLEQNAFFELTEMFSGYTSRGEIMYSNKCYTNYKPQFQKLLNQLKADGNEVVTSKTSSNIKPWPFISLNDRNLLNERYFDNLFEKL